MGRRCGKSWPPAPCRRSASSISPTRWPTARESPLGRNRPPGPQTRKRDGHPGWCRQDSRLRARQAPEATTGRDHEPPDDGIGDEGRHGHGHGRLHVARAGEREVPRFPVRPVFSGLDSLRDGDGQPRLPAKHAGRDADSDHPRRAGAARACGVSRTGSVPVDRRAVSAEGPGRAIRLDEGSRTRARGAFETTFRRLRPRSTRQQLPGFGARRSRLRHPPRTGSARRARRRGVSQADGP